jgi:hypothetical protein
MYFVLEFGFQASVAEFRNCLTNLGAIEEVLKPWFLKRSSALKRWGGASTPKRSKREARRRFTVITKALASRKPLSALSAKTQSS